MPENKRYPPEGSSSLHTYTVQQLREAQALGTVLEGYVQRCDPQRTLHLSLGGAMGEIAPNEAVAPWISGAERDISILSRVGKLICFTVLSVQADEKGTVVAQLSRRAAQEQAMEWFLANLRPGSVLSCRVLRSEPFGAFLDIGCGIVALLPIERISVSRVEHPGQRFLPGQKILAVVQEMDPQRRRFTMTHRELLGTWMENASRYAPGETVRGIVRGVQDYGCFVELAPNLSGLADKTQDVSPGSAVSVYIKSIRPEKMKIKLQIIETLPPAEAPEPLHYQITDGCLDHWVYSPPDYIRDPVETVFTQDRP